MSAAEWTALVISALSLLLSCYAMFLTRKPFDERKLLVFQKLFIMVAYLRQFSLQCKNLSAQFKDHKVPISFQAGIWDQFGITENERIEFAMLDLQGLLANGRFSSLPARLKEWFEQKPTKTNVDGKNEMILHDDARHKMGARAEALAAEAAVAMAMLRKEFPWIYRFQMK